MKTLDLTYAVSIILASALSLFAATAAFVPNASAAVADWQKAGAIQPRWDTDFGSDSFKTSVQNLRNAGANYVALVIPYYQSNAWSTDIQRGWNTPTDASLAAGIDYAHSLGLKVALKPHLESYDGQWRANINPGDRDTWYRNYQNMLMNIARIGQAHGAEELVVGTELISMATFTSNGDNTQRWQSMIGAVRTVFSGALLYSANWGGSDFAEEVPRIGFWGSLDYIGISAYYPLSQWGSNDVSALKSSWDFWKNTKIKPISDQYGKPILFTEMGYRSVSGAHNEPWNSWMGGSYDAQEQVNDYTALFSYWNDHSFMKGGFLWDWSSDPNAGGPGDIGYTPQRKPAEDVMKQWFGNPAPPSGGGGTTPPPSTGTTFSAAGSATPSGTAANQPVSIQATLTAHGTASNVIVDMEVFSSSGEKVHQQFRENESFTANQSKNYTTSFTPAANGTYTATLGVFNSSWSQNFFWTDLATIAVGGATPPPPPGGGTTTPPPSGPATIDVWWPADGSHVTGVQPWKAMMPDRDVDSYSMFWQVDGDRLNDMYSTPEGYPHKEAWVDLSGWNWKDAGSPYTITFTAKSGSGSTEATKSVNIFIP